MATTWADIIAAAMVLIDDVRLEEQLSVSPAQFYRRMVGWVNLAMPKLNKPPEFLTFLKSGKVEPQFDDFEWVSTEESTRSEKTVVDTEKVGYELCSVTVRVVHDNGTVTLLPYPAAEYDAETGKVTFPKQEAASIDYELDFYTDGEFPELTETQMRLFALSIAALWDNRFARNWLAIGPKIHDESFDTPNEQQYMEKSSKRLHENMAAFHDELRDYEQLCAYAGAVQHGRGGVKLV